MCSLPVSIGKNKALQDETSSCQDLYSDRFDIIPYLTDVAESFNQVVFTSCHIILHC